jgi:hypothetical protein
MQRYLRKSAGNGLERGFGPAAIIEPAASAAVRDPQRAEDPQPLLYTPHWAYEQTDGEGQNGNSGLHSLGAGLPIPFRQSDIPMEQKHQDRLEDSGQQGD